MFDWKRATDMAAGAAGLTLNEVADRSGIGRSHLFAVRARQTGYPSVMTLVRISNACGVPLSRLIYWAEGGN